MDTGSKDAMAAIAAITSLVETLLKKGAINEDEARDVAKAIGPHASMESVGAFSRHINFAINRISGHGPTR